MENLVHGTRGQLHQISRKVITNKNFSASNHDHIFKNNELNIFFNKLIGEKSSDDLKNKLIAPFNRKKLFNLELDVALEHFNLDSHSYEFLTSTRCFFNKKMYHSLGYSRKGQTNSYCICYNFNNKLCYANILDFIEFEGNFYALINKYKINSNWEDILPKTSGDLSKLNFKHFFNKFYVWIKQDDFFMTIIDCKNIICKCLIIKTEKFTFLTKLIYDFEHD